MGVQTIHAPPPEKSGSQPADQTNKSKAKTTSFFLSTIQKSPIFIATTLENPLAYFPGNFLVNQITSADYVLFETKGLAAFAPSPNDPGDRNAIASSPLLQCPGDISTYTDINTCTSFIGGNLNPGFDEDSIATLTWEMTGATSDASPGQGIHLIDEYTFNEGATQVTYNAVTTAGRPLSCTFTVTISDNQVPRITRKPNDIKISTFPGECYATVDWEKPLATDNCTPANQLLWESTAEPGISFNAGTTTVFFRALDAMGNESQSESFTITVEDTEPPVFSLPPDTSIQCDEPLPAPWQTLQQIIAAGGSATDNCAVDPISLQLAHEEQDSETCPYTLIRTYEIADSTGNTTTVSHRIFVEGEEATTEEGVRLKGAMEGTITAHATGNWNQASTWDLNRIPLADDDVVIPNGYNVTVTTAETCKTISIEGGGNLEIQTGGDITCSDNVNLTIPENAELIINGGSFSTTNSLINEGLININSGTVNIGQSDGNSLHTTSSGIFEITDGTLNIAARFFVSGGDVTISGGTINVSKTGHSNSTYASFHISANTDFTIRNNAQIDFHKPNTGTAGDLVIISGGYGTKNIEGGTFVFGSNITGNGAVFLINSPFALSNITINSHNNPGILISGNDLTINGELNMNGGNIDATAQNLILSNPSTSSVSRTSGHVTGNLQRAIAGSGTATYLFPVGNGNNYTPLQFTFNSLSSQGDITVFSNGSKHPNIASSLLNSAQSVNNYWSVNNSGVAFSTVEGTFDFPLGLADGGDYLVGLFNESSWSYPNVTSASSTSVSFNGLSSLGNISFALAECTPPDITLGTSPGVCEGTTSADLPYSSTTGSPVEYRIDFDATSEGQGFSDVNWTSLPTSPISVNIPGGASPGTYNATLLVLTEVNCESSGDALTITIEPDHILTLTSPSETENQTICINNAITNITYSTGEGATGASVTAGNLPNGVNGNFSGGMFTISGTPMESGTFNYTVTTSGNSCDVATANGSIIVNPLPSPTITGNFSPCQTTTATYTTETGMSDYNWSVSAGGSFETGQGTNEVTVRWGTAGNQAIEVIYTNTNGCSPENPTVETVSVFQKPALVINHPEGICTPGTVDLTAPAVTSGSTGGLSFSYFSDSGGNNMLSNPDIVGSSGTYYIQGGTTDGCYTDIKPVNVTIYPEVNVVITDPDPVCTPATVNLTNAAITSGSTSGLTFSYWTDAAATSPLTNYTTVATSGTYYIKGETTTGCYDIQPVYVTINTTPEVTTSNTKTICSGESTDITLAANVPASFSWTIGDVTGDLAGYSADSGNSINQTLTATGEGGTIQYLITPETDDCMGEVYTITVTVNTLPTVTQQPETPLLVCGKSNTAISSYSIASPAATIQWEYSMDGTTGWAAVPDGLIGSGDLRNFEFDGTTKNLLEIFAPDSDEEVFFRAAFNNSCGTTYSDISHVIVDKKGPFVNTDIDQEEVACVGGDVTLTAKITGAGAGKKDDRNTAVLQYNNNGVWEEVPGSYQESNNSGHIDYSYTINTGNYPYEPEFRIYVTGKCGTTNTTVKILYLQSVVTTLNSCIHGGNVQFLLDDAITTDNTIDADEGWTVTGGGSIDRITGEFTPTTPGCYEATYQKGNCIDTKPFVVFPEAPQPELTGGCGTELEFLSFTAVSGFNAEFAVQAPGGTLSEFGTLTQANAYLNNTPGCWTVVSRYTLSSDCSTEYATIPAETISPCGEYTRNELVLPEPPVLNTPANACNTSFSLPSVPSITGFSVEWKIDDNTWVANPTLPTEPGCHTIQARYVLDNSCGTLPAGSTGEEDCVSNIVSVVIFPPAPTAPEVTAGCGAFEVTPPATITGFGIEYSFDDGATWGTSNQSPTADDCSGYVVKTRYVLAAGCGNTNAGDGSSNSACSESPATNRIIDTSPPVITCAATTPEVCVNAASQTYLHSGTSWDASAIDACGIDEIYATLSGQTTANDLTTLNDVEFNQGTTTVTWTASDGCNTSICQFTVTVYPKAVVDDYTEILCSDGSFEYAPIDGTNGIVPSGTTYSWSAPSITGITGAVAGTNETHITGTLTNTTDQAIDVIYNVTPSSGICNGDPFTVTITVNPVLECIISGPAEPLCPNTEYTFSAETGMSNYAWSITGEATISENTDGETVTIQTADVCDGTFTLFLNYNDASGCGSICELMVLIGDETPPAITIQPANDNAVCVSGGADANPDYQTWLGNNGGANATDHCSGITWTNNSTTQTWVIDTDAHTKTKTVTFTATDKCGNSVETNPVTFTITDDQPPTITCPGSGNPIVLQAITGECEVTEYTEDLNPVFNDDCSDPTLSFSLILPDGSTVDDVAGSADGYNFPLGETTVIYIATDDVGNEASCQFTVFVEWTDFHAPIVDCPPNPAPVFTQNNATEAWVNVSAPTFSDPCSAVESMEHDSPYSTETDNANGEYPIGTTIVTWTITDVSGNTYECEQEVIVLSVPVIECPDPITISASPGTCSALLDPPKAALISGGHPIVWTYTITWPEGTSDATVTFDEETEGINGPPVIGEMEFPVGITTIYWTATNEAGSDECSHIITVTDDEAPTFTTSPYENCVDPLHWASYDPANANPVINHINPLVNKYPVDFRTFEAGNTALDISGITDNCCNSTDMIINWRIDFSDTPDPQNAGNWISHGSISGTGQPSTYGSDIELWGDGVEFNPITHTITYWITDCHGNESESVTVDIVIKPRPEIIKANP